MVIVVMQMIDFVPFVWNGLSFELLLREKLNSILEKLRFISINRILRSHTKLSSFLYFMPSTEWRFVLFHHFQPVHALDPQFY